MLARFLPLVAGLAGGLAVPLHDARAVVPASDSAPRLLPEVWGIPWVGTVDDAVLAASARGLPILVYARADHFACTALEGAAGVDPRLAETLRGFVPLVLDLDAGGAADARRLGIPGTPYLAVTHARTLESGGGIDLGVALLTGALHEPIGLTHALEDLASARWDELRAELAALATPADPDAVLDRVLRLESLGRYDEAAALLTNSLAAERDPNGLLHRFDRLRTAILTHTVTGPADAEGTIEEALLVEDDDRLLYFGWSLLASVFELRALAADDAEGGVYRGVDARRWRRRMRSASREAWIGCPDALVVPFGSLLIRRYGASPADLDSADRIFCQAVVRTLRREAPDHPRVEEAAAVVEGLR